MELIIIIVAITAVIVIYSMMNMKIKELKAIALNKELNEIAKKLPTNKEICEQILKKLGNNTTKIEENENSEATLYIAIQDNWKYTWEFYQNSNSSSWMLTFNTR